MSTKPKLIFLAEPKILSSKVPDRGSLIPSIWGLYNHDLVPTVLMNTDQHISLSVLLDNKVLHFCVVYASTSYLLRRPLWSEVQHTFIDNAGLISLPTTGAQFTWSNRRIGNASTEKRLDKAMINDDWVNDFTHFVCCTMSRVSSDHFPLLFSSYNLVQTPKSSFKFHKMWLLNTDCRRLVAEVWNVEVVGCPMFVLSTKLKNLKKELIIWNHNVFGNIHQRVLVAKANVVTIQNCINDHGPENSLLVEEDLAQSELMDALLVEESF
ncbi:PREDICTED: uncharacterized protein LOC109342425 [Lupinus angustifolius]|uniref:uncharacterized protein LOC109342425 n=1 Tax=Lupinus angustifolius TaxID=3871 RepID=UPI00092E2362|nr:PREDICTED: uncharacterized protein LOC109342425 [Lupinus angustifolius]